MERSRCIRDIVLQVELMKFTHRLPVRNWGKGDIEGNDLDFWPEQLDKW